MKNTAFILVVRINSLEKLRNLHLLVDLLNEVPNSSIYLIEADSDRKYFTKKLYDHLKYKFIKDESKIFHRTKYINQVVQTLHHSIIGICDMDIILSLTSIKHAIQLIHTKAFQIAIPHSSNHYKVSPLLSLDYEMNPNINILKKNKNKFSLLMPPYSFKGLLLIDREIYIEIGLENENIIGMREESFERIKRLEALKLPIYKGKEDIYELYYPQEENCEYITEDLKIKNKQEIIKICNMDPQNLREDILKGRLKRKKKFIAREPEDNSTFLYKYLFQNETFFPENNFCLLENHNLAFVSIAKNGMTFLKNIAVYEKTGSYPEHMDVHSMLGTKNAMDAPYLIPVNQMATYEKRTKKYIKFAVWRDPVERLISCYKCFCLEKNIHPYFRFLGFYEDISFEQFMIIVKYELQKKDPLKQDDHIRRQVDYFSQADVDYIVPLKKLNEFLVSKGVPLYQEFANKTTVKFTLDNHQIIEEIKDLYAEDYKIPLNY